MIAALTFVLGAAVLAILAGASSSVGLRNDPTSDPWLHRNGDQLSPAALALNSATNEIMQSRAASVRRDRRHLAIPQRMSKAPEATYGRIRPV